MPQPSVVYIRSGDGLRHRANFCRGSRSRAVSSSSRRAVDQPAGSIQADHRAGARIGCPTVQSHAEGAQITIDGQALLPHARELLRVHERAVASVHPGRRALRVDVLNRRIAPAVLIQDFYRANPGIDLDVVTLSTSNAAAAIAAVRSGEIDATIRAVTKTSREIPDSIRITGLLEDPLQVLVGPSPLRRLTVRDPDSTRRSPDLDSRHRPRHRVVRVLRPTLVHIRSHD